MFDVTQILIGIISLVVVIATTFAVQWLRAKVGDAQFEQLSKIADFAVNAAEQFYRESGKGEEKLAYAIARVNTRLAQLHLTFDEEAVRAAIEVAVLGLKKTQVTAT